MPARIAEARWEGVFPAGKGTLRTGSGALDGPYSFGSRFEGSPGTNPEELIGAAEAGCFSMSLAKSFTDDGYIPHSIHTTARVHLEKTQNDFSISQIELHTEVMVPGIDDNALQKYASHAAQHCIVSRALKATKITIKARSAG